MTGLSTAWRLARLGLAPLVLETNGPGAGATGRNAGFIATGTTDSYQQTIARFGRETARTLLRLTVNNCDVVQRLVQQESLDCDFRRCGRLHLSLSKTESDGLRTEAALLIEDGLPAQWLDRQALARELPIALSQQIDGAILSTNDALLHSGKLIAGLAMTVDKLGGDLARARVLALEPAGKHTRIITSRGTVLSRRTLVAVNAWTARLLPELHGVIVPVRGQMLSYHPVPPVFERGMTASWTETGEYWQQAPDGSILIGGCRSAAAGRDVSIESLEPTEQIQDQVERLIPRLFPSIGSLRISHRWAGTMAFTPDHLPVVGPVPRLPGTWVAGGFSGHGMAKAFGLSQWIADGLRDGPIHQGLQPFSPERFDGVEP